MKDMFSSHYIAPPGEEGTIPAPTSTENYVSPPNFVKAFAKWSNKLLAPIIDKKLQKVTQDRQNQVIQAQAGPSGPPVGAQAQSYNTHPDPLDPAPEPRQGILHPQTQYMYNLEEATRTQQLLREQVVNDIEGLHCPNFAIGPNNSTAPDPS